MAKVPPSFDPDRATFADHERGIGLTLLHAGVRDGRAGFGVRVLLMAGVLALCVAFSIGVLEMIDRASGVRNWHLAVFVPLVCIACLFGWFLVWVTYRKWRRVLKTAFVCLCVTAATVAACVAVGMLTRRPEPFVTAIAFGGASLAFFVIGAAIYQAGLGNRVNGPDGAVRVNCPGCGYSLAGLASASCPECGFRCTLEQLIRAQNYEGVVAGSSNDTNVSRAQAIV